MGVKWIEYKGKKILFIDYKGLKTEEEMINNLELAVKFFNESSEKILSLADFSNSFGSQEFMRLAKKYGKEIFKAKTQKSALLGISGIKNILLKAYSLFSGDSNMIFDSEIEAKEYLVKD